MSTEDDMPEARYPFKNETGQRYSKQLFYETWSNLPVENRAVKPLYTLYGKKEGYVDFGRKYINYGDTTGYKIALEIFRDYSYWEFLMRSPWFRDAKEQWDREIAVKEVADSIAIITDIAKDPDDKGRLSAAKFLFEHGIRSIDPDYKKPLRGRPSKEEISGKLKEQTRVNSDILNDLARIKAVGT